MPTSNPNFPEAGSAGETTFPTGGARGAGMSPSSPSPATPAAGGSGSRPLDAGADALGAAASAADNDVMRRVVQGAHEAVDRLADKAIPAVERLRSSMNDASDRLHERASQAGELKDEWTESLRTTIREHPLASIATALAVGVILSRLSSSDR